MSDPRPDLGTVRTQYQVPDDEVITYRPRAFGAVDIPFTSGRQMTKTEGELLDGLTQRRGLLGLSEFRDIAGDAFARGTERYPDNPVPEGISKDQVAEWQGNDGHRDAFRHAYWSARLAQEYGADWARAFTTAHEGLPGNVANREAMDLYNNSIGIQIGAANPNASPEELANLVQNAVTHGKTVVINGSGDLEWSDRVPVGQHGLTREDVLAPHMQTPKVVPTKSAAAQELSPHARNLLNDSEQQVRQLSERHGLPWDQGMDNTVAAIAHHARTNGLTGINQFHVAEGRIRYGQYDGYTIKDGSIDARLAANTPAEVSQQRLLKADQAMNQTQDTPAIEQGSPTVALRA